MKESDQEDEILDLGRVFQRLRKIQYRMTLKDVSIELDRAMDPSAISRVEANRNQSIKNMQLLADLYDVKLSDVFREAEGGKEADPIMDNIQKVPLLRTGADISLLLQGMRKPEWDRSIVVATTKCDKKSYGYRISGESMQNGPGRQAPKGFIAICDPSQAPSNGDLVIYLSEGEAIIREILIDGSVKLLKPTNLSYPTQPVTDAMIYAGKVIQLTAEIDC